MTQHSQIDQTTIVAPITSRIHQGIEAAKSHLSTNDGIEPVGTTEFTVASHYACEYLDTNAGVRLESSSVEQYDRILTEYVDSLHERGISVLAADKTDVIEYIEDCVERGNRESTLGMKLSVILELYTFIRLRLDVGEALDLDPIELEDIDLSDYNTRPTIEREALSREEVRRLFDAMDSYRNRLMTIVAIETGLRNSDLRTIRVRDVDFDVGVIHVSDPKNGDPYDVPISHDLAAELKIWRDEYRSAYGGGQTGEYLFPSQHSEKLETNGGLNQIIKAAAEKAGLQATIEKSDLTPGQKQAFNTEKEVREWKRVTVHTLRHTCLTLMKEDGVSLQYRQLVANHAQPGTTLGYTDGEREVFGTVREQYNPPW